jgi:hypothetical protein
MKKTFKYTSLLVLLVLVCVPLATALAATGTPVVTTGYDSSVDYKAAIKFQSFNNSDNAQNTPEVIFGAIDWNGTTASFTTESVSVDYNYWILTNNTNNINPVKFSYDQDTGYLIATVNSNLSQQIYVGDLGALNYIKIEVRRWSQSTSQSLALNNLKVDGAAPSGNSFVGEYGNTKVWNIFGLTFTDGFTIEGEIVLSKQQPGQDKHMIEISVGHYDILGPVTTDVKVNDNLEPVYLNGQATLSANIDDSTTWGSNIASADFNLSWNPSFFSPMVASDGTFDEVSEDVNADFIADAPVGEYIACVQGTDNFWHTNTGTPECQKFVVTYVYDGFYDPVLNDPELYNLAKAGQAVPIKWRLTDANGVPIDNPNSFVAVKTYPEPCDGGLPIAVEDAAGASGLQYLGDGYWQYNWKTPKTYASTCRSMYVEFNSGTISNIVVFQFK